MSQKSILRKPNNQSRIVNIAARASAKRNVRFVINEKNEEETKHAIPEHQCESDMEREHSYSDLDKNYNNNENKNEENEMEVDDDPSSDYVPSDEDIGSELEDVSTSEDEDENEDDDKMETDDDPSSDYVPSDDDDEDEDDDENDDDENDDDDEDEDDDDDDDDDDDVFPSTSTFGMSLYPMSPITIFVTTPP